MEFCAGRSSLCLAIAPPLRARLTWLLISGGGIIDMMNRRLRERLTEEEILQVFVDVCEVSASLHVSTLKRTAADEGV